MSHPNMTASALTTGAASLLVWLLHSLHINLSIYQAGLIVGGASTVVLFVGRRGLKATALGLWRGTGTVWNGKTKAK